MFDIKFSFSRFSITSVITILLITLPLSAYSAKPDKKTDNGKGGGNSKRVAKGPNKNTAAVITGVDSGIIIEDIDPDSDNLLEFSGKLDISDADIGEAAFNQVRINGSYGSLAIDYAGDWYYAAINSQSAIQSLGEGNNLADRITVSSLDGTKHNIVINIKGTNDTAIVSGESNGSVTEDDDPDGNGKLEVGGKLDISDVDTGEAAFVSAIHNGNYGNLSIDQNGAWKYSADNNQQAIQNLAYTSSLHESLTVTSIDGTHHDVVVTILGADEPEVINTPAIIGGVDSGTVTEDGNPNANNQLETFGTLTIEDPDPGEAGFIAEFRSAIYGSFNIDSQGNWGYSVDNSLTTIQGLASGQSLTDSIVISSIDGTNHIINVNIEGVDEAASALTLSWVAPVEREDNMPISPSEISGYRIYYGTSKGQYPNSIDIDDGSATGYTFTNLTEGSYFFVVTTYDTDGRESKFSTEVVATL